MPTASWAYWCGDHPRVCGEHGQWDHVCHNVLGSSPRVRGTLLAGVQCLANLGIIPACAGNTSKRRGGRFHGWDHPRVCGEHFQEESDRQGREGSSPRVRGTRWWHLQGHVRHGIIPACAGNTTIQHCAFSRSRDHPRVCGEHPTCQAATAPKTGSSPRVRGTREETHDIIQGPGIIPACAGNTCCPTGRSGRRPGSSPRVRGTPACSRRTRSMTGIIPACAGNTGR